MPCVSLPVPSPFEFWTLFVTVNLAISFTKSSSFVVEIVSDPQQNYLSLITVIVLLSLQSGILTFLKLLCFIILARESRMTLMLEWWELSSLSWCLSREGLMLGVLGKFGFPLELDGITLQFHSALTLLRSLFFSHGKFLWGGSKQGEREGGTERPQGRQR